MYDLNYDYSNAAIEHQCKEIIQLIVDYNMTIREVADNTMLSKSTVHNRIHTHIKSFYNDEYHEILTKLRYNRKYRSKPRKYW